MCSKVRGDGIDFPGHLIPDPIHLFGTQLVLFREFQHLTMRPRLTQETKPFHNPAVKVNQFVLGKHGDIDLHELPPNGSKSGMANDS
jgi:hypothetical protein